MTTPSTSRNKPEEIELTQAKYELYKELGYGKFRKQTGYTKSHHELIQGFKKLPGYQYSDAVEENKINYYDLYKIYLSGGVDAVYKQSNYPYDTTTLFRHFKQLPEYVAPKNQSIKMFLRENAKKEAPEPEAYKILGIPEQYNVYKVVGFKMFCKMTGYTKSEDTLIKAFRNLPEFKPSTMKPQGNTKSIPQQRKCSPKNTTKKVNNSKSNIWLSLSSGEYRLYSEVGFERFVDMTGYPRTRDSLVHQFKKLPEYVPLAARYAPKNPPEKADTSLNNIESVRYWYPLYRAVGYNKFCEYTGVKMDQQRMLYRFRSLPEFEPYSQYKKVYSEESSMSLSEEYKLFKRLGFKEFCSTTGFPGSKRALYDRFRTLPEYTSPNDHIYTQDQYSKWYKMYKDIGWKAFLETTGYKYSRSVFKSKISELPEYQKFGFVPKTQDPDVEKSGSEPLEVSNTPNNGFMGKFKDWFKGTN